MIKFRLHKQFFSDILSVGFSYNGTEKSYFSEIFLESRHARMIILFNVFQRKKLFQRKHLNCKINVFM